MDCAMQTYLQEIQRAVEGAMFRDEIGIRFDQEAAYTLLIDRLDSMRIARPENPHKVLFVGNGGSAAIASHMAEDFTKAARIRALCFNDGPLITCLANDYSFPEVFQRTIEMHADSGDVLIAISSSGRSPNIIRATQAARAVGCDIITLSGFDPENPLGRCGSMNIFTPAPRAEYGVVENAHQIILHYILDQICAKPPK